MSYAKDDWILWANRFQTEHITLLKRVQEVETQTSQLPQLQTQLDKLGDGQRTIQQSNAALVDRTSRLDEAMSDNQQKTTRELSTLQTKIAALEKEKEDALSELEQWKSQAVALLEKDYEHARQELYRWKTQIDTQRWNPTQIENPTNGGDKETLNQTGSVLEPASQPFRKHHRTLSEATTADESLLFTENAQTYDLHSTQIPTRQAGLQCPTAQTPTQNVSAQIPNQDTPSQRIAITRPLATQGRRTLEDYLQSGNEKIPLLIQKYEAELVMEFVERLREKQRKATLRTVLQKNGLTWEILKSEIGRMIEAGKVRKKAKGRRRAAL